DSAKTNLTVRSGKAEWFHIIGVPIGNGTIQYPNKEAQGAQGGQRQTPLLNLRLWLFSKTHQRRNRLAGRAASLLKGAKGKAKDAGGFAPPASLCCSDDA